DEFTDFVSRGLFAWKRHYTTERAKDDGPIGHGWRHFFQRSLHVHLHRATFVDWNGTRVDFPRFEYGSDTTRAAGRVLRRVGPGHYRVSRRAEPDLEFAGGQYDTDLRLVGVHGETRTIALEYDAVGRMAVMTERDAKSGPVARYELRYDAAGHISHVLEVVQ